MHVLSIVSYGFHTAAILFSYFRHTYNMAEVWLRYYGGMAEAYILHTLSILFSYRNHTSGARETGFASGYCVVFMSPGSGYHLKLFTLRDFGAANPENLITNSLVGIRLLTIKFYYYAKTKRNTQN